MNFSHIEKIVRETLDGLPFEYDVTTSDHALVFLTFLAETNMYQEPHKEKNRFGMMSMHYDDLERTIHDFIIPIPEVSSYVYDYSMVDVHNMSDVDLQYAADYNIAFQVILTYLYFLNVSGGKPESAVEAIRAYQEHWNGTCIDKSTEALGRVLSEYVRLK